MEGVEEQVRSVGRGEGGEEAGKLLEANRNWAESRLREDPETFLHLTRGQHPPFLFIGCCDSRKPLDTLTRTRPGELFIHRNIANMVTPGDTAAAAVLEFAVGALDVRHIIVCGHTHCGGVAAALSGAMEDSQGSGPVWDWLDPLRRLARSEADQLAQIDSPTERTDRLAAVNVVEQLGNVLRHPVVQWRLEGNGGPLHLHGWLYHVESGLLEALPLPATDWVREGLLPSVPGGAGPEARGSATGSHGPG
jgi:carbonic anhydrase